MRVGVVGLGAGTLATYGKAGDQFRFYEINPAVVNLAHGRRALFSYLRATPAEVAVVTGDARVSLERELGQGTHWEFDVLALDAFNSDSIPVHLLTREALSLYLAHLGADGVLAVHISNRYLDLEPMLARLAQETALAAVVVEARPDEASGFVSRWMLLARDAALLPADAPAARLRPGVPAWTDDHSNLLAVFSLSLEESGAGAGGVRPVSSTLLDLER
jgi:spermidine synthase